MPGKKTEKMIVVEGDCHIPLFLYREMRSNARISIGKDAVHLRVPLLSLPGSTEKHLQWAKEWIRIQLQKKPALGHRFRFREYRQNMPIRTALKEYSLAIKKEDRVTISSKVIDHRIVLKVPPPPPGGFTTNTIQRAIANAVAKDQLPWLSDKVHYWNDHYFGEKIASIRMKYVQSKWGSCSSERDLLFSSRLLLVPEKGIDYVIVHELAHLKELNHSPKFWDWVRKAMPDYKTWDKKLRHHGHEFDF